MPTESGATDVNGATKRLSNLFQKQPELERPTGEGESPSQGESQMPEEAADESYDSSETLQSDTEEQSRRFKAKLGDQEVEFELLSGDVDIDQIPKGLMMEADYRRKTMETADLRKSLEAKQQELDAKFNEAAELIQFDIDNLESPEMAELKEYDPEAYWKKVDQIKSRGEKLQAWRQAKQKEIEDQNKSLVESQREQLTQLIPDWLDAEKQQAEIAEIQGALKGYGFNDDEIAALKAPYDSRLLSMARKAMLFDKIQSQDLESKRVKAKPKAMEPSGGKPQSSADKAAQDKRAKLKKTGNIRDAQEALRGILNIR